MTLPYYEVLRGAKGPPILLVHGFLSSRAQWLPNLEALARVGRPVLVELLGHGRSPSPAAGEPYAVAAYLDAFDRIRRLLGAEQLVLCGQSFGAGLTMRYAIEHRERVLGQIVTNSISGFSPPSAEEDAAREARARAIEEGGRTALEAIPFHPRHAKRLPRDAQRELVRDAALLSPLGIAQGLRLTRPDLSVAGELGRIRVPTLLVNGLWEKRFQPMRDVAAAGIPGVRVVDLEGGHSINLEAAGAFDEAVCGFIRFLPAAPERIRAHG